MDIITITVEDSKNTQAVMQAIKKGFAVPKVNQLLGNGVKIEMQHGDVVAEGSIDEVRAQLEKMRK